MYRVGPWFNKNAVLPLYIHGFILQVAISKAHCSKQYLLQPSLILGQRKIMFTSHSYPLIFLSSLPSNLSWPCLTQSCAFRHHIIPLPLKRLYIKGLPYGPRPVIFNLYLSSIPTSPSRFSLCCFLFYADDLVIFASKHSLITAFSYFSSTLPISSTSPALKIHFTYSPINSG